MKIVEKKILPKWCVSVMSGAKTFEYRKDEDDIQCGDVLWLREYDNGEYTGGSVLCLVGIVLRHSDWADIPDGFCVISLRNVLKRCYAEFGHILNGVEE